MLQKPGPHLLSHLLPSSGPLVHWTEKPANVLQSKEFQFWGMTCKTPFSLVGGWTNPFEKYATVKMDHFPRSENNKYLSCHHLVLVSVVFFPDCLVSLDFHGIYSFHIVGGFMVMLYAGSFRLSHTKTVCLQSCWIKAQHQFAAWYCNKLWEQGVLNHIILITWFGNKTPAILLQNTTFQTKVVNLKDYWQPCNHHAVFAVSINSFFLNDRST